ncbi:MAG TPA: molybdopterin-dependent oxidoreductase [Kofleriaceae bacterium]|nr:molybdopterin-dependent oxidoreductase [Kofleriaceae bacterium]
MSQTHFATCTLCEATCGVAVEVDGGRIQSIRGDEADPFSRGYICPKAAALQDLYEDPDRLRQPVIRRGRDWEPIGWDEAFDQVAHRLKLVQKAFGGDAVAVYQGNPTAHSLGLMTFGQLFMRRLGTRNLYSATSADQLPHMLSSLTMFGHQVLFPVPDIDRTDYFLVLGGNPLVSNGSVMTAPGMRRRLKELRERGGKLVVVDPRRSETAAVADRHLFIRPGSDAALLLAMLNVIFADGRADLGHLAGHVDNDRPLRAACAEVPPERVAAVTGIAADDIRALAREFAAAPRAVCYGRVGACTQEFGGLTSWLINCLNLVTGHFDRAGGAMFATPPMDVANALHRVGHSGGFARFRSRVSGLPEFGGELPVAALAEEIETPGAGQVRALITSAGNPVLSTPNGRRLEQALTGLEFMVSIDPYINETTRHAHIILPPTSPLERDHYDAGFQVVSVRNVAKWAAPVFPRGPEQRHDWEICIELMSRMETSERPWGRAAAKAMRAALLRVGVKGLIDAGLRLGPYKGLTLSRLQAQPHGVDLGPLQPRLPDYLYSRDKRIDLAPRIYQQDLPRLLAWIGRTRAADDLVLIGRRQLRSNNSWMHNAQRLMKDGAARCTLLVHPDDAARLRLQDGSRALARSRVGAVEVTVEVSDEIMPGVVSLPHGWGHSRPGTGQRLAAEHPGASLNDLTDEQHVDALSGTCAFSGVPVTVTPLA